MSVQRPSGINVSAMPMPRPTTPSHPHHHDGLWVGARRKPTCDMMRHVNGTRRHARTAPRHTAAGTLFHPMKSLLRAYHPRLRPLPPCARLGLGRRPYDAVCLRDSQPRACPPPRTSSRHHTPAAPQRAPCLTADLPSVATA
eukprot:scaffold11885_cov129-Isochrysis_galbana.AAC.16